MFVVKARFKVRLFISIGRVLYDIVALRLRSTPIDLLFFLLSYELLQSFLLLIILMDLLLPHYFIMSLLGFISFNVLINLFA
jgi:hypothetical protein